MIMRTIPKIRTAEDLVQEAENFLVRMKPFLDKENPKIAYFGLCIFISGLKNQNKDVQKIDPIVQKMIKEIYEFEQK